ncbi:ABC transporter ATP-binding protein [Enterococcus sp. LJL98]
MNQNVVSVNQVKKVYGKRGGESYEALKEITFSVEEGEFVGIMGPSGSGKTTLLNMLSALDQPTSGDVQIGGQEFTQMKENQLADFRSQNIGFIFQDFNLLENLTLFQNIALPLSLQGVPPKEIAKKVEKMASILAIQEVLSKYPTEVSGGQKQRAAAARALIHQPKLLLGDEPTGALDSKNARNLLEALRHLNTSYATTILMVTHDPMSASYCQRILFIQDGKIYKEIKRQESQQAFYQEILATLSHVDFNESQV